MVDEKPESQLSRGFIYVKFRMKTCLGHFTGRVDETHMPTVDTSQPVIQAEISPGQFVIIDGNHRLEKAHRNQLHIIPSRKIRAEQLLNYFTEEKSYSAFVKYWNEKLRII